MHRQIIRLILILGMLTVLGHAQQKPKRNAEVLVAFDVCAQDVTYQPSFPAQTTGTLNFYVYDSQTGQSAHNNTWNGLSGASGQITHSGPQHIKLKPNRLYSATINRLNTTNTWGEVKISAPLGYTAVVEGIARDSFRAVAAELTNNQFTFVIRENGDGGTLPAGMAVAPDVGDFVWTLSTGTFVNGLPLNPVQLRGTALTASMLSPTSLSFVNPNSAEINVTNHSDGGLLEVDTYQAILYFRRGTPNGGYTIEVYSPYAIRTGSGDGPYTYNEAPYREFRFSVPGGGSWNNNLQIEKIEREGATTVSETWTVTQSGSNWTIVESSSLRTITRVSTGTAPRIETVEVKDNANVVATKLRRTYSTQPWSQEELVEEVANPDAVNGPALTTTYDYYTGAGTGGYGRLKSVINPDGSWSRFDYDSSNQGVGNLTAVYQPWQNSAGVTIANATAANSHATLFTYVAERSIFLDLPTKVEQQLQGKTTGKSTIDYTFPGNAPNGHPLRQETIKTYTGSGSGDYLTTTRALYDPHKAAAAFRGRLQQLTSPTGQKVSTLRYQGYWWNYNDSNSTNLHKWPGNPAADTTWGEYRFSGFSTQVQDSQLVNNWDGQSFAAVYMVPNRSTVDLDIHDDQGRVAWRAQYVFTGASAGTPTFEFLSLVETAYDNGIPVMQNSLTGAKNQAWLTNGRITASMANDGAVTNYGYDALGRPTVLTREAFASSGSYPAQTAVYLHRVFDASDRVLSETITPSANNAAATEAVTTTRLFSLSGLLRSETAESGGGNFTTNYAYTNGGLSITATFPGGATKTVTRWLDGSVKSSTGTADLNSHREVTVNADGTLTTAVYTLRAADLAAPTSALRWTKVTTDWAGRTIKEERPAPPGASPTTFSTVLTYNSIGQLVKRTEPQMADTLIEYNAWQQPYRSGLKLTVGTALDTGATSLDRITETDAIFEKDGNAAWWAKTTTKAYKDNSATPITASVTKTRINKYSDHGRLFAGYVQAEQAATDIFGNTTKRTVAVQRGGSYFANDVRLVTDTIDHPDATTDEVRIARNGQFQKHQTNEGLTSWTYYDNRGRPLKSTDPRTDTSTTARIGYVANSDRVAWRDDPAGNRTTYGYTATDGRLYSETRPVPGAGLAAPVTYSGYNLRGQAIRTWGNGAYPVETAYNDLGESIAQRTFRDGTNWGAAAWPLADSGLDANGNPTSTAWTSGDKTQWTYDPASGTLSNKKDASNNTVAYTYDIRGQLKNRTWARTLAGGAALTTTYGYDNQTGEQISVSYPAASATTNLTAQFNRLGQMKQVGDATGTRLLDHCICGKISQETLDGAFYGGRVIQYKLEQSIVGVLGRTNGYTLFTGATAEQDLTYGHDAATGRFNSVTTTPTGFSATTFTYTYTANSSLLASIADTASGWTQTRTYLANRDLLDVIETKVSTLTKAKFDYDHDALGRRTNVVQTGELFARYVGAGLVTKWGYNDRSEVMTAQTYTGTNPADTSNALLGRNFAYAYDNIGNRTSASVDAAGATFTPNALNQYTSRAVPGSARVAGLAPAAPATVTVNGSAAGVTRQGEYYHQNLAVTNTAASVWQAIMVAGSAGGTADRHAFVALTPEPFSYDADGNLTRDGRWVYQYDAENRPLVMFTRGAPEDLLPTGADTQVWNSGVPRQRIEYAYDYLGRRVRKTVFKRNAGNTAWVTDTDLKFVYDGWNLIAEYNAVSGLALTRSHAWGLDWSGTRQGAGGVGGLLQTTNHSGSARYLPAYDGNGNLMALVNQATGALAAEYEYDAFGQTLRATGGYAGSNPFRYSTKYYDFETNLIYYGRRYYTPTLGRFLTKDPIQEQGGLNLYGFVRNNAVNHMDYLGMDPVYDGGWLPKMTVTPGPGFGGFRGGGGWDIWFGGGGGGGGSSGSDGGSTSDDNTPEPTDEVVPLPTFVVTGTRPVEPVVPHENPNPIDPGDGGQNTTPTAPNNPERWSDEKCKGLARQITSRESVLAGFSPQTPGIPSAADVAQQQLGAVDASRNILTDTEGVAGSAAALYGFYRGTNPALERGAGLLTVASVGANLGTAAGAIANGRPGDAIDPGLNLVETGAGYGAGRWLASVAARPGASTVARFGGPALAIGSLAITAAEYGSLFVLDRVNASRESGHRDNREQLINNAKSELTQWRSDYDTHCK